MSHPTSASANTRTAAPRGAATRPRWSAAQASKTLGEAAASGLTLNRYAELHGMPVDQLYWWRKQLAKTPTGTVGSAGQPLQFVRIVAQTTAAPVAKSSGVALRIGEVAVAVDREFCEVTLARVLAVIGAKAGGTC